MSKRGLGIGLVFGCLLLAAPFATAQQPAAGEPSQVERAQQLLKEGKLDDALEAYGALARAEGAAPEVQQKFLLLQRTVKARGALAQETDADKWWKSAETLRTSYYSLRVYGELLDVSKKMHERKNTPGTASFVADALLLLDRGAEAEKVLTEVGKDKLSTQGNVLLGLAYGRQKKVTEAKAQLDTVKLADDAPPRLICDVARLKVACGDIEGGMATLAQSIGKTSPKAVENFRTFLREVPEFASLPESAGFAKVLMTKPAGESACSAGPDCAKCPKSGECPSGGGEQKKN